MLCPVEAKEETSETLRESQAEHGNPQKIKPVTYTAYEERANAPHVLRKPEIEYQKLRKAEYAAPCLSCQDKEKVIQRLESQLEEVRHRLVDKDKQNEDLKTNLERVIASKDEMLTLYKEQLEELKAKLEEPNSKALSENMRQSA